MLQVNKYLVVTPAGYILCNDIRHIINIIKPYCYRLNSSQLKCFNSAICTHIKNSKYKQPLKKGGTRNKFIINADIYVVKLTNEEIKLFY